MNALRRLARATAVAVVFGGAALSFGPEASARLVKYGLATMDLLAVGPMRS
jgi:hypothetical protein